MIAQSKNESFCPDERLFHFASFDIFRAIFANFRLLLALLAISAIRFGLSYPQV